MRLRRFAPKLHRSVFVGFDPIIESEVPEKRPLGPTPNGRKVILIVPKL